MLQSRPDPWVLMPVFKDWVCFIPPADIFGNVKLHSKINRCADSRLEQRRRCSFTDPEETFTSLKPKPQRKMNR